jgi:hypothetical protein
MTNVESGREMHAEQHDNDDGKYHFFQQSEKMSGKRSALC